MEYYDVDEELKPDWIKTNGSDGQVFYGYDDENGYTDWYDSDNNLDSRTETPSEADCDDYLKKCE